MSFPCFQEGTIPSQLLVAGYVARFVRDVMLITPQKGPVSKSKRANDHSERWKGASTVHPGMLQEVFNLEEGPVTLMFPGDMSEDSYQNLEDRLKIVLRGLKRRAYGHRVTRDAAAGIDDDEAVN
jgi:hypothetical protein